MEKLKTAWEYFMYYPDKTEVILQVHLLNPLFSKIESVVFYILNLLRTGILFFKK